MMKTTFIIYLLLSALTGFAIAWIDSQPNWDDTGITALMLVGAGVLFGFLSKEKPWFIALTVSIWIPILAVISTHNYGGFLALIPAFVGAYTGYILRRIIYKP